MEAVHRNQSSDVESWPGESFTLAKPVMSLAVAEGIVCSLLGGQRPGVVLRRAAWRRALGLWSTVRPETWECQRGQRQTWGSRRAADTSLWFLRLFLNTWAVVMGNQGFGQTHVCTVPFMVGREPAAGPSGPTPAPQFRVPREAGVSRRDRAAVPVPSHRQLCRPGHVEVQPQTRDPHHPDGSRSGLASRLPSRTGGQRMEGRVLVLVPGQGLEQGLRSFVGEEAVTRRSLWDSARRGPLHSLR